MIKIDKIIPGGEALGTDETGKKIFFWNALPGETIEEYEITKKKSHYSRAIATKINHSSEHRIEPKDDCFLSTSPWQNMDYNYELSLKQDLVVELFREIRLKSLLQRLSRMVIFIIIATKWNILFITTMKRRRFFQLSMCVVLTAKSQL